MSHGADPKLLEALNHASSLQLFQLQTIIERMLADPKRIIAVRANMHLGQTIPTEQYGFSNDAEGGRFHSLPPAFRITRAESRFDDGPCITERPSHFVRGA